MSWGEIKKAVNSNLDVPLNSILSPNEIKTVYIKDVEAHQLSTVFQINGRAIIKRLYMSQPCTTMVGTDTNPPNVYSRTKITMDNVVLNDVRMVDTGDTQQSSTGYRSNPLVTYIGRVSELQTTTSGTQITYSMPSLSRYYVNGDRLVAITSNNNIIKTRSDTSTGDNSVNVGFRNTGSTRTYDANDYSFRPWGYVAILDTDNLLVSKNFSIESEITQTGNLSDGYKTLTLYVEYELLD